MPKKNEKPAEGGSSSPRARASEPRTGGKKAYVIAVDMGYGHQRAAAPLLPIAEGGEILNANNYRGIPAKDRRIWRNSRKFYEWISRFKKVPLLGNWAFQQFDKFQRIKPFYPKRDHSESIIQVNQMFHMIKKHNWGKHLIDQLEKKPLPIITTFFVTAFMAEIFNYSGDIYLIATDTDISRSWVSKYPASSRIKYLAPTHRVVERLRQYGVRQENIFLTGFPLPLVDVGGESYAHLRKDLSQRLANLDPKHCYSSQYKDTIMEVLGERYVILKADHPLTLMFAVGGAGAQKGMGIEIAKSLKRDILNNRIRLVLVAGVHNNVNQYFKKNLRAIGLGKELGTWVKIIHAPTKLEYFKKFNHMLRETDILWTKPSELSFFTALGIPIIMADPIGSQEDFNREWLMTIGSGRDQKDVRYTHEWLFDWLESGYFAEAAVQGFVDAPKEGTYNVEKVVFEKGRGVKKIQNICQI